MNWVGEIAKFASFVAKDVKELRNDISLEIENSDLVGKVRDFFSKDKKDPAKASQALTGIIQGGAGRPSNSLFRPEFPNLKKCVG